MLTLTQRRLDGYIVINVDFRAKVINSFFTILPLS